MSKCMIYRKIVLFFILVLSIAGISGHLNNSIMIRAAFGNAQENPKPSDPQYAGQLSRDILSSADYIQQILSANTSPKLRWQFINLTTTAAGKAQKAAFIRNEEGDLFYVLKVDSESLLLTFATHRQILFIREVIFKVDNKTVFNAMAQHPIPIVQENFEGDRMNGLHLCVLHGKQSPPKDPLLSRLIYGDTLAIEFYGEQDKLERVQFSLKESMASIRQVVK